MPADLSQRGNYAAVVEVELLAIHHYTYMAVDKTLRYLSPQELRRTPQSEPRHDWRQQRKRTLSHSALRLCHPTPPKVLLHVFVALLSENFFNTQMHRRPSGFRQGKSRRRQSGATLFNVTDLSTLFSTPQPSLLSQAQRPSAIFEGGSEVDRGLLERRSASLGSRHGRVSKGQRWGMQRGGGASLYGQADELGPMFSSSHTAYGMLMSPPAAGRSSRVV